MDSIKIGQYIAYKRKQKGLTQQELANILMITNKAVSKWETGTGIPDVSILKDLANALGVSVDELLEGEDKEKEFFETIVETEYKSFTVNKKRYMKFINHLYFHKKIIVFIMFVCGSLFITGGYSIYSMNR